MFCRLLQKYIIYLWNLFPQISFFLYLPYVSPSDVFSSYTKILNFMFPLLENYMATHLKNMIILKKTWFSIVPRRSLSSLSCAEICRKVQSVTESPCCLYICGSEQKHTRREVQVWENHQKTRQTLIQCIIKGTEVCNRKQVHPTMRWDKPKQWARQTKTRKERIVVTSRWWNRRHCVNEDAHVWYKMTWFTG